MYHVYITWSRILLSPYDSESPTLWIIKTSFCYRFMSNNEIRVTALQPYALSHIYSMVTLFIKCSVASEVLITVQKHFFKLILKSISKEFSFSRIWKGQKLLQNHIFCVSSRAVGLGSFICEMEWAPSNCLF